ncbi:MAG: DUF4080 domain-containing protein [Betaproteobacteria bacterium]
MISPALTPSPAIVLATLNAKYIHASLGLRYLLANLGELRPQTVLCEFTIARKAEEIVDELLSMLGHQAPIIGFGVYVWNVRQTLAVLQLLRAKRPGLTVILGGPEVSHETEAQEIVGWADYVITGWGDVSFPSLCRALLAGQCPAAKVIAGEQPPLAQIALPYAEYTDADLAHRLLYVEASRGCPFKCEFCLSALDKTAWAFDLENFLAEMATLFRRGARHFKFVDRTFNLKTETSVRILQFFLQRLPEANDDLFLHFEMVPDHLPEALKQLIVQFPAGSVQLEVGVQSFNPEVQQRISRQQDNAKTESNLRWLLEHTHAHIHADLIFGLPGETLDSFAAGFDRLLALHPHEIQLGLLKRLRGAPLTWHTATWGMVYDSDPPYTVRQTAAVDSATMQRFVRFSHYWDKVANSGRFRQTLVLLLGTNTGTSPFYAFLGFSDWLWQGTEKTSGLSPELLVDALAAYLCGPCALPAQVVQQTLLADYVASGARSSPRALQGLLPKRKVATKNARALAQRQERHRE